MLRFEGGDTSIALGHDVDDHLLLHSEVLKAASPFFEAGMKACWNQEEEPKKISCPDGGEEVQIFRYALAVAKKVASLQVTVRFHAKLPTRGNAKQYQTDSGPGPYWSGDHAYLSDLAAGFVEHITTSNRRTAGIKETIKEHQALFLFLHQVSVEQWLTFDYVNIANIIAYAELYQVLPHVAVSIETYLLNMANIWFDVRESCEFYLGIASKLRSSTIFQDAFRHFIGKGLASQKLTELLGFSTAQAALLVLPHREKLAKQISDLTHSLQRLGLTPYIAHEGTEKETLPVGSTFLSTGFHRKSTREKVNYIARSIWNEWLIQQLAGMPHWSHTRHSLFGSGDFEPAGLRITCNAIAQACHCENELSLFDYEVASKYTSIFFGDDESWREIQGQISDALILLVRTANTHIQPMITPSTADEIQVGTQYFGQLSKSPSTDQDSSFRRRILPNFGITTGGLAGGRPTSTKEARIARNDAGCNYFTYIQFSGKDLPWYNEEPWKAYTIDGLNDASDEWLELAFAAYPTPQPS